MTEAVEAETQPTTHVCPECAAAGVDTSFTTPAALGVHRSRKHGVAGKTTRKPKAKRAASSRVERRVPGPTRSRPTRSPEFDGAALLEMVNNGHPLTPDRLKRLQAWLAEGEALFRGD